MTRLLAATLRAMTLALLIGFAPAAMAQSTSSGEAELAALLSKDRKLQEILLDAHTVLLGGMDHINASFEKAADPLSASGAREWAAPWASEARASVADLRKRFAAAPRITPADVATVAGGNPAVERIGKVLLARPAFVEELLTSVEDMVDRAATLTPQAASGDEKAIENLVSLSFKATTTILRLENAQLESAIASLPAGHPEKPLGQSILASNKAMSEFLAARAADLRGEKPNLANVSKRALAHLADAQAAAGRISLEATAMLKEIETATAEDAGMVARIKPALASYADSATVEEQIVKHLRMAAEALPGKDDDLVDEILARTEPLMDRRVELQQQRLKLVSE